MPCKEFRLGIIGQCFAFQPWIGVPQLYHQQLKRMLKKDSIELRIKIARNVSQEPRDRLNALIQNTQLDGILLVMRDVSLNSLFMCHHSKEEVYRLHPFFFHRKSFGHFNIYNNLMEDANFFKRPCISSIDLHDQPISSPKWLGIPRREFNFFLGSLFGLDEWAIENEWASIERFVTACQTIQLPCFILGPLPRMTYRHEFLFWKKMNRMLKKRLIAMKTPHCLVDDLIDLDMMLKKDKAHITAKGHLIIAERLYQTMPSWINSLNATLAAIRPL